MVDQVAYRDSVARSISQVGQKILASGIVPAATKGQVETMLRGAGIRSEQAVGVFFGAKLLMLTGLPLLGWLMMSAYRVDVVVFGLFTLPHLLPQSDTAFEILSRVHMLLGLVMAVVIAAHAGGALMHGFLKRDGVLQRMLPAAMAQWLDKHQARGGRA